MNTTALKIVLESPFLSIFDCIIEGKIVLYVSNEILFEYQEILTRKANARVAENVVNFITVNPFTEKNEIFFNFDLIKEDADDNKFVDCAIASNAICLASNDNHFNVLKTIDFPQVTVLKLAEFETKYKTDLTEKK